MSGRQPLLVFFGHHKAGTQWADLIFNWIASELGLRYANVCNPVWFGFDLQAYADQHGLDFVSYTNAEPEHANRLREFRGLHVIRDPRDMAVSAYFSHLHSHPTDHWPELRQHRRLLGTLSTSDGLLADMRFTDRLPTAGYDLRPYRAMAAWAYDSEQVMEFKFESLIADPLTAFLAIFDHFQCAVDSATLGEAVRRYSFEALSGGRARGQEDLGAHYRRGVPGDWLSYFGHPHLELFHSLHGDLAARLGY